MPDSKHSCPLDAFPNIWSFHTFLFRSFDPHPPSHGLGKVLKIIFFGHIFLYFCPVCDMYITNRLWFTPGPLCLSFGVMSLKSIEKDGWLVCCSKMSKNKKEQDFQMKNLGGRNGWGYPSADQGLASLMGCPCPFLPWDGDFLSFKLHPSILSDERSLIDYVYTIAIILKLSWA